MHKNNQSSKPSKQPGYNPSDSTNTQNNGTSKNNSNPATQTKNNYGSTDSTTNCK